MTYPTYPQFRFRLEFQPLYFAKRHANVFLFKNVEKKLKNRQILKGIILLAFRTGGHVPCVPPRGAAYEPSGGKAPSGEEIDVHPGESQ